MHKGLLLFRLLGILLLLSISCLLLGSDCGDCGSPTEPPIATPTPVPPTPTPTPLPLLPLFQSGITLIDNGQVAPGVLQLTQNQVYPPQPTATPPGSGTPEP